MTEKIDNLFVQVQKDRVVLNRDTLVSVPCRLDTIFFLKIDKSFFIDMNGLVFR